MNSLETAKAAACAAAVSKFISPSTRVVGIGSGSTIIHIIKFLKEHTQITAFVPTSFQASQLISEAKLPLASLSSHPHIDVAFDGADEIDSSLNCIKGGGGCALLEKIVASNAKQFVLVADDSKFSSRLGTAWKRGVALEVSKEAWVPVKIKLEGMGAKVLLRMGVSKAGPVVTDSGNFILDADFGEIADPAELDGKLHRIPGILETGLFCNMADAAFLGSKDGTFKMIQGVN